MILNLHYNEYLFDIQMINTNKTDPPDISPIK